MKRSRNGSWLYSNSVNWSHGRFDPNHFDPELRDGGLPIYFMQWSVHWLCMDHSHLQLSISFHHFHWISSNYEETEVIQWGRVLFESGYESVRFIWQWPDGKMEMIIVQEVVYCLGSFNLILQSWTMDKDTIVELVNHYGLNLYNLHYKFIATEQQVDKVFVLTDVLGRDPESTESTNSYMHSCLLEPEMPEHASQEAVEKRTLWPRRLAHRSLKWLEILQTITDGPRMTCMCHCLGCIK